MQLTPEQTIEDLKAIIDKYEYPELFSFLDYYELHFGQYQQKSGHICSKNTLVSVHETEPPVTGIVMEVKDNICRLNIYGEEKIIPLSSSSLSRSESKVLPLEWAKNGSWGDLQRFKLKTLASFLYLAHHFDKIQSLSNSRTQILDHQIESTYKVVNSINPRFLIADEVGLGKTIEAGLIIKEFIIRHNYHRILIVVPASLQFQWQQEMRDKFNENFDIIDGRTLAKRDNKLPDKVIISLDFAKQEKIKALLIKKRWDTLIFDEAHKLRRDEATKTQAYTLAEELGQRVNVLLLLSATPFSGKLEELYYLIRLLNPSLLGSIHNFSLDYTSNKKDNLRARISSVLIRRRKVDVGGFTRRYAKTISFELTEEEQALYERTTEYIRNEYNKALETQNNIHFFILTVYQKMLDSCSFAIVHTIASRIEYLKKALAANQAAEEALKREESRMLDKLKNAMTDTDDEPEEVEELSCCGYSKEVAEEMKKELSALEEILRLASRIKVNKKGEILKRIVTKLLKANKKEKILIFTQFARTQDYLCELLKDFKVSIFNGRLDKKAKDKAILEFQNATNILICTEAGGEGRNLQFCRYLINYDLPWNPQKIEQRIGRLHRFGQKHDVNIYNFSTKDTIGARILDVLENKIKIFEDSIGTTDTLLGYYEDEIDFNSTFMKFHVDPKSVHEELEHKMNKSKKNFKYLEELTAHKVCDFNLNAFYEATCKEREASNKLIQHMMEEYASMEEAGLRLEKAAGGQELYTLGDLKTSEKSTGYFDNQLAIEHPEYDFFAFGNRLIDTFADRMREPSFLGLSARVKLNTDTTDRSWEGVIFNFIVNFRGNRMSQQLMPVYVDKDMLIDSEQESRIVSEFLRFNFKEDKTGVPRDYTPELLQALYQQAVLFLEIKIKASLDRVKSDLEKQIGLAIPLMNKHYESIFTELENLLQVQRSKEKIFNLTTMKSLISRTENKIKQFKKQRETELERIKNIKFIHTSYSLLNLALLRIN